MPQVAVNISPQSNSITRSSAYTIALAILLLFPLSSGCASKAMHSSATDIISSEEITITPAGIDLILTEPITRQPKDIRLSILLDLRPSVAQVRRVIIPDDVNSVQLEAILIATDGREVRSTHAMPLANTATSVLFTFDEEIESEFSIDRVRIASNRDLLCKQVAAIYYFDR